MKNKLFIYGAPGVGKTTLSIKLRDNLQYPLVEADYLREVIAQKEKTEQEDPFVYVGTKEAWQKFGDLTKAHVVQGLKAVRKSMAPYVSKEMSKYSDSLILEAAFLNPQELKEKGQLILVITTDEKQHRKQYFEHRKKNPDQIQSFRAARMIQGYLVEEAKKLSVAIVENNKDMLAQVKKIISTKEAENEIQKNFPKLRVRNVKSLDEGMDSRAFLVNDNLVFRFPKHPEVARQLKVEIKLLPELRKCVDVKIPNFQYIGKQKGNNLPFVGYPFIKGQFLHKHIFSKSTLSTKKKILEQVGTFIAQVHSFPVSKARKLGVKTPNYLEKYKQDLHWWRTEGKNFVTKKVVTYAIKTLNERLRGDLKKDFEYVPTLIHADIHPWHVLYDSQKQKVLGIIDFGDVCIGDPDYEYLRIYDSYGVAFAKGLIKFLNHPNPEKLMRKLKWFTKYNMLEDVAIGAKRNDKDVLEWAIARLTKVVSKA